MQNATLTRSYPLPVATFRMLIDGSMRCTLMARPPMCDGPVDCGRCDRVAQWYSPYKK
jgi:hypothetical protein